MALHGDDVDDVVGTGDEGESSSFVGLEVATGSVLEDDRLTGVILSFVVTHNSSTTAPEDKEALLLGKKRARKLSSRPHERCWIQVGG